MRATRGAAALVIVALLAVGAGCADPTQEQPGDATPSAGGVEGVAPGGLDTVDWPDDSEGAAALFAELPTRLGSLRIEVLNEPENEGEWYEAVYHDPRQELGELDQSSQVARVSFGVPSVGGPPISRAAQVAGTANWWSGPAGCVGQHHSPVFAEFCSPAAAADPTVAMTALEQLEAAPDPEGPLFIEFVGGPSGEDGEPLHLHLIVWSDSAWVYLVAATTAELRTAAVEAVVSAAPWA